MAANKELQQLIKQLGITQPDSKAELPLKLFSQMSKEVYDLMAEPAKFKSSLLWTWEPHFTEAGWAECIALPDSGFDGVVVFVFKGTADARDFFIEDIPHIGLGVTFPLDIMKDVASRIFARKQQGKKMLVTGHSLGGYLAEVASTNFGLNGIGFCVPGPGRDNGEHKMPDFHYINMIFDPVVNLGAYNPFGHDHKDYGVFIGDEVPFGKFHKMASMHDRILHRPGWTNVNILAKCKWTWKMYYYTELSEEQSHRRLRRSIRLELPAQPYLTPEVKWTGLPGFSFMTDKGGWDKPRYYETVRMVSVADSLFVFGRANRELNLASFDTKTNKWEQLPGFSFMTDKGGWDKPKYYETIRVLTMGYGIFVFGRANRELNLASFDTKTNKWEQLPGFSFMTDKGGWDKPKYYETIQVVSVAGWIFVFGRANRELNLASFNTKTKTWKQLPGFPFMTDKGEGNWDQPMHYKTISLVEDCGDELFVFGRGCQEIHLAGMGM